MYLSLSPSLSLSLPISPSLSLSLPLSPYLSLSLPLSPYLSLSLPLSPSLSLSIQTLPSLTDDGVEVKGEASVYCIPWVEACGLVTLCSYRSVTRRLSLGLLKEVRSLHEALAGEANKVSTH